MAEEVKLLGFDELGLTFGLELELLPDPADKDRVFPCDLVGCVKNECVIVGPPASTGAFPRIVEGQRVALRVKLAGGIALIPSTVLFISEIPTILFFLDFPRDVVFKQVRGALRVNVALPVLGTNVTDRRFEAVPGKMIDVSTTGARLHMFQELGNVGHKVEVKGKFQVGDIQRIMQISATVRARSVRDGGFIYGIEFSSDDEDKLIVLMGFTFHAMAFGSLQTIR
jgi:PilZ domain.